MKKSIDSEILPAFGKYGSEFQVVDYQDLLVKVREIIPTLKLKKRERINQHRESYVVLYYLLHQGSALRVNFPYVIKHQDRPDFEITFDDKTKLGIEISEATSPEYQKWLSEEAKKAQITQEASNREQVFEVASINSGLVGDAVEEHFRKAKEGWIRTISAQLLKKIEDAKGYDYSHNLELVLYSNTGDEVDDYKSAIEEFRKSVHEIKPYKSVSILVGSSYLLGDISGNLFEHNSYVEFDELENALESLERVSLFIEERFPYTKWKWAWLALYHSFYGFLINALKGTNPDDVLQPIRCPNNQCQKSWPPGTLMHSRYLCPKCGADVSGEYREALISFDEALKRVQTKGAMSRLVFSQPLTLTKEEIDNVGKLKELSMGLFEFVPRSWLIGVGGVDKIIVNIMGIIDRLVSMEHNIFLSDDQERRKREYIDRILWLMKSPVARDFGG